MMDEPAASEHAAAEREAALDLLERVLEMLDRVGPVRVAATVSLALVQAGREPPPPPGS